METGLFFAFFQKNSSETVDIRLADVLTSEGTNSHNGIYLYCTLKIEYQINRYVTCVSSLAAWYAKTLLQQPSENPNCKYQIASDKAITHTATMILLYGAGGGPGRGEKPMSSVAAERLLISLAHGALRTNNVHQLHIRTCRRGKFLGGSIYEIRNKEAV